MALTVGRTSSERMVRSAIALMLSTVASSAFGVLFWIVGARLYSVDDLGRASAAASAITLLGSLAQLSLGTVMVRFLPVAGSAGGRLLGLAHGTTASIGVILTVGFCLAGFGDTFLPPGPTTLLLLCGAVVGSAFSALQDGALTGLGRPQWVPVRNVSIAVGKLVLLVALVGAAVSTPIVVSWSIPVIVGAAATGVVVLARRTLWRRSPAVRESLPTRRELASFVSAQYLSGIVVSLHLYLPPVLVTMILGPAVNGSAFYIPWLVANVAFALSWNIGVSFVVEATSDPGRTRSHLRNALRLLVVVNVAGGVFLALTAPVVLQVLGRDYAAGGADTLRLIGLALPFEMILTLFSVTAIIEKKTWPIFWMSLSSTAIFLVGCLWGLHTFGVLGAGGAFLVAETVVGCALLPATVRRLRALVRANEVDVTRELAIQAVDRGVAPVPARGVASVPGVGPASTAVRCRSSSSRPRSSTGTGWATWRPSRSSGSARTGRPMSPYRCSGTRPATPRTPRPGCPLGTNRPAAPDRPAHSSQLSKAPARAARNSPGRSTLVM